eukprot:scaffold551_cov395-Prasinococcus_capsulatus_cf.AAC.8
MWPCGDVTVGRRSVVYSPQPTPGRSVACDARAGDKTAGRPAGTRKPVQARRVPPTTGVRRSARQSNEPACLPSALAACVAPGDQGGTVGGLRRLALVGTAPSREPGSGGDGAQQTKTAVGWIRI